MRSDFSLNTFNLLPEILFLRLGASDFVALESQGYSVGHT